MPKSKTKIFPLFISSCIPSPIPANCHINFSSKPNNLYFIYIFFSLSPNSHRTFIHSLFLLLPFVCFLLPSAAPCGPTTVRMGHCFFSHRAVLEAKKTAKLRGPRFSQSDHTVQSGFQNLALETRLQGLALWSSEKMG